MCLKKIASSAALLVTLLGSNGFAQDFFSLHQLPKTVTLIGSGSGVPDSAIQLTGIKDTFSPFTSVGACVLGYSGYTSLCSSSFQGYSGAIANEYSNYTQYRVYVPAGIRYFVLNGFMPQNAEYAAVLKFDSPPTRTQPLSVTEYDTYRGDLYSEAYQNLDNGLEVYGIHNYGGTTNLAELRPTTTPLKGRWLYVRVLNGSAIYNLQYFSSLDLDIYAAAYSELTFDAVGDPVEARTPTPAPAPAPAARLTGITLSSRVLVQGMAGQRITVKPVPETATAPSHCVSHIDGTITGKILAIADNALQWQVAADAQALTEPQLLTLTCGGFSANLAMIPQNYGVSYLKSTSSTTSVGGPETLSIIVNHDQDEVIAAKDKTVQYFIAANLPGGGGFFTQDMWFFLSPKGLETGQPLEWTFMTLSDLGLYAAQSIAPWKIDTTSTQLIEAPLQFNKADLKPYKAKIHFGYRIGDAFVNKGVIWDSTVP